MKIYQVVRKKCYNVCGLKRNGKKSNRVFQRENKKAAYRVMDKVEKGAW